MRCDSCDAAMIQGVFCHETGCPNIGSRYDAGMDEWVKVFECRECGEERDKRDGPCDCMCMDDLPGDDWAIQREDSPSLDTSFHDHEMMRDDVDFSPESGLHNIQP